MNGSSRVKASDQAQCHTTFGAAEGMRVSDRNRQKWAENAEALKHRWLACVYGKLHQLFESNGPNTDWRRPLSQIRDAVQYSLFPGGRPPSRPYIDDKYLAAVAKRPREPNAYLGTECERLVDAVVDQLEKLEGKPLHADKIVTHVRDQATLQSNLADQYKYTEGRHFVCSDIHLLYGAADEKSFKQLLDRCENDHLVLLGDVLDFWIDESDPKRLKFVETYWKKLYEWLEPLKARDRNVHIHYVPGNHDSFVFTLEASA